MSRHFAGLEPLAGNVKAEEFMSQLGVVHLVRARNGLQPFADFLDACAKCPPGARHDLLIVFKGFKHEAELQPYRDRLKNISYKELRVSDVGVDLRAYSIACQHFEYTYLCFMNSYCVPLQEGWLEKMFALVHEPDVGAVGATGSWESMYTNFLRNRERKSKSPKGSLSGFLRLHLNRRLFRPFPNHHLRTNAFLISRKLMLEIWPRYVLNKATAYIFENGRHNFTQRVLLSGFKPMVLGRDGRGYEKEEWAQSNTFRQSSQENLLVADNQTRAYATADFENRKYLSTLAWGDQANPAKP